MTPLRYYVPTRDELRAIARRYRPPSPDPPAGSAREPDGRVLDLAAEPFDTVDDVRDRLSALERHLRGRGDRRSVFLTVYVRMTEAVADGIEAGEFHDPGWVRSYLVAFANYYRRALLRFERDGGGVPRPWRIAFGASLDGGTVVLQDALLGINAHINYDLAYTIRDVSIDPDRRAKRRDHDAINDVLARLVDAVQEALVAVYPSTEVGRLDDLFGRLDEVVALAGLVEGRALAWRNAVLLTDARVPGVRRLVRFRVRTVSTGAAHLVLSPGVDPASLRAIEGDDPPLAAFAEEFRRRTG